MTSKKTYHKNLKHQGSSQDVFKNLQSQNKNNIGSNHVCKSKHVTFFKPCNIEQNIFKRVHVTISKHE
jgi:hypothetical protein